MLQFVSSSDRVYWCWRDKRSTAGRPRRQSPLATRPSQTIAICSPPPGGNLAVVDELFAPDYVSHAFPPAFPDLRWTLQDVVGEGETVIGRCGGGERGRRECHGQAAQGGIGGLASMLGLNHSDPAQMDENDVAKVAAHAQQNNLGALAATAAQYQNQPNVLQSLLGNKALLLAGAGLAAGVMSGQLKPTF